MVKVLLFLNSVRSRKALSLMEILVAIGLLVIVVGMIYAAFSAGNVAWHTHENVVFAQRKVRMTLIRMARDLREASDLVLTQNDGVDARIDFTRPSEGSLYYLWDSQGANPDQIIRGDATTTQIISTNIANLQFTVGTQEIVIDVTAGSSQVGGHSGVFSLKRKVSFR